MQKIFTILILVAQFGLGAIYSQTIFEVEGKAIVDSMQRVTNSNLNVVRLPDGILAYRKYEIGDFAQGGIVFYVDESGEHGLVCDTVDISTGIVWGQLDNFVTGTGEGKFSGEMNTILMLAAGAEPAARLCSKLVRGDYGDWFLPSITELECMNDNRTVINSTAISNGGAALLENNFYWSSNEDPINQIRALALIFGSPGAVASPNKDTLRRVRAVRAF